MNSMMKRALSMLLVVCMVIGIVVSGVIPASADSDVKKLRVTLYVDCIKAKTESEEAEYSYYLYLYEGVNEIELTDSNITEKSIPNNDDKGTAPASIVYKGVEISLATPENKVPTTSGYGIETTVEAKLGDIDGASAVEILKDTDNYTTFNTELNEGVSLDGASIKWSLAEAVEGVSINETSGKLTVGKDTADEAEVTVVAKLVGSDGTVFSKVTKDVSCKKAEVTGSSLTTSIDAGAYKESKSLVETFEGYFLTEELCKEASKLEITSGSVTPSYDVNESKTEATLTYTYSVEGKYAYKYDNGNEVEFTIDKTAPTADITLTNAVVKDSKDNKKSVVVTNEEEGATVKIGDEETNEKEYTGTNYNDTESVSIKVTDDAGNETSYKESFIKDIKVKVSLYDGEKYNEITSETKSNTIGEVRYFDNKIKLEVTGIPEIGKDETLKVEVGEETVTPDKDKYIKTLENDGDKLESTAIKITYTKTTDKGIITKVYTAEDTLKITYGVDITAPKVTTEFNNVVENTPVYAKEEGEGTEKVTTIYVKLKDKVTKNDNDTTGEDKTVVITGTSDRDYNNVKSEAKTKDEKIAVSTDCEAGVCTTIDISSLFVTNNAGVVGTVTIGDYTITKGDYTNGKYVIAVDRATPVESKTSPAHISIGLAETNKINGIYTGNISFNIGCYDPDSGIDGVKYWVENSYGTLNINDRDTDKNIQTYTLGETVTLELNDDSEQNDIKLVAEVTDKTGNISRKSVTFNVDNRAPRVSVSFDNNSVKNVNYFNAARTATVSVTDLNFDASQIVIPEDYTSNTDWSDGENANEHIATYTFDPGEGKTGEYTFSVDTTDKASHNVKNDDVTYDATAANEFIIDREVPAITILDSEYTSKNPVEADNTIYYQGKVTFTFTIKDTYLDLDAETDEDICYLNYNDGISEKPVIVDIVATGNPNEYKATISLEDTNVAVGAEVLGDVIESIEAYIIDKAGNVISEVSYGAEINDENISFTVESGKATYTGYKLVADAKAPELKITLPETSGKNSYKTNYYFDAEQSVSFDINEINLDKAATTISLDLLSDTDNNGEAETVYLIGESNTISIAKVESLVGGTGYEGPWTYSYEAGVYTISYALTDGIKFTSASVSAIDKAKNDSSAEASANIVIDTTAPTVHIDVQAESGIDNFYKNGDQIFVNLSSKNIAESGAASTLSEEEVTITVTVNDKNIAPDAAEGFKLSTSDPELIAKESNAYADNVNNTFTYTKTILVPVEENKETSFAITVADLAGNKPVNKTLNGTEGDDVTVCEYGENKNDYVTTFDVDCNETGTISQTLNFDRRRITSKDMESIPEIIINEASSNNIVAYNFIDNGRTLYNSAVSYKVYVKDQNDGTAAGLDSVVWTVVDDNNNKYNDVTASKGELSSDNGNKNENNVSYGVGVYEDNLTMPITFGTGESNDITLTITATDKLGNQITAIKYLAIDTVSPRVTYTIDKTPSIVSNTTSGYKGYYYFNEVRKATITVTDINFDPEKTAVTIKDYLGSVNRKSISESGWSQNNITYTKTITFGSKGDDQDYTVNFKTVDKALNETSFGNGTTEKYRGRDIVKSTSPGSKGDTRYKFTVDMVNPTLAVSYDNNSVRNGKYYKANRTATVTINERNFDDLRTENGIIYTPAIKRSKGSNPSLSAFPVGGTTHAATINYNVDGDYSYTLKYKDLAGNSINPDTFTQTEFVIDKTIPYANIDVEMYKSFTAKESVTPKVTLTDLNFNSSEYTVTSMKLKNLTTNETVTLDKSVSSTASGDVHGVEVTYADLKKVATNDGIYTLTAKLTDMAGNSFETTKTYSVNRFGSTYYAYDEATKKVLNDYYNQNAPTLKIAEVNPDKITEFGISFVVNTQTISLKEGSDFAVNSSGSNGTWNSNIYTINSSAFMENGSLREGEYIVSLTSKDEAGHSNSNRSNTINKNIADSNSMEFAFVLDATAPVATITGIEDSEAYEVDKQAVTFYFEDSSDISKVKIVVVNSDTGAEIFSKTLEGDELDECNGKYTYEVEENDDRQTVTLTVYDKAGNEQVAQVVHIFVNSSWLAQWFHNTPLFVGSVAGFLAVAGGAVFFINKKKKAA